MKYSKLTSGSFKHIIENKKTYASASAINIAYGGPRKGKRSTKRAAPLHALAPGKKHATVTNMNVISDAAPALPPSYAYTNPANAAAAFSVGDFKVNKWGHHEATLTPSAHGSSMSDILKPATADRGYIRSIVERATALPGKQSRVVFELEDGTKMSIPFMDSNKPGAMSTAIEDLFSHAEHHYQSAGSVAGASVQSNSAPSGGASVKVPDWLKDRPCIYPILNDDGLCGQRALAAAIASVKARSKMKTNEKQMMNAAYKVVKKIGIQERMTPLDFDKFSEEYGRPVVIMSGREEVMHTTDIGEGEPIYLFYDFAQEHYHLIVNMTQFSSHTQQASAQKWCHHCRKAYPRNTFIKHECVANKCKICKVIYPTADALAQHTGGCKWPARDAPRCSECNEQCFSPECLAAHMETHKYQRNCAYGNKGETKKLKTWKCSDCFKNVAWERHITGNHVCGEVFCQNCQRYHAPDVEHRCSIMCRGATSGDQGPKGGVYAFDFECMPSTDGGYHTVNFSSARKVGDPEAPYIDHDNIEQFCDWFRGLKSCIVVAHNLRNYDGWLIHNHLKRTFGAKPTSLIRAGGKIMQMKFGSVTFLDSLNHIASSLAAFPKTFGLDESKFKKGEFPHLFNRPENQDYVGPIPAIEFYEPEKKSVSQTHKDGVVCAKGCGYCDFKKWYDAQEGEYDFKKELIEYCHSDVDILAQSMEVYIRDGIAENNIHPLTCVTCASYALKVYRTNHMPTLEEVDAKEGHKTEHTPTINTGEGTEWAHKRGPLSVLTRAEYADIKRAFSGGRTEVFNLHSEWTPEQVAAGTYGSYKDIVSLYPTVQYHDPLPYGPPTTTEYTDATQGDFDLANTFGFVECDVTCPQDLHIPVLGAKKGGKFVFDLRPVERQLLCTPELQVAVAHGYKITHVYKTITFKQTREMFRSYIRGFLKTKTESNGFDGTDEELAAFKQKYKDEYDIELGDMTKNKGRKAMSKLCLNSLWGKFGQSPNMKTDHYCNSVGEWLKYVRRAEKGEIIIHDREHCGDSVLIQYTEEQDNKTSLINTNIALCAMITSHARCRLYEVIGKLGDRVRYCDTDSCIYERREGEYEPPSGKMLGEWEDELSTGECMTDYAAWAPKAYSYKTNTGGVCVKSKGVTLNKINYEKVNHDSYVDMAKGNVKQLTAGQLLFKKTKRGMLTTNTNKVIRMTAFKREVHADGSTSPFR